MHLGFLLLILLPVVVAVLLAEWRVRRLGIGAAPLSLRALAWRRVLLMALLWPGLMLLPGEILPRLIGWPSAPAAPFDGLRLLGVVLMQALLGGSVGLLISLGSRLRGPLPERRR
jgi:hypothetical protein